MQPHVIQASACLILVTAASVAQLVSTGCIPRPPIARKELEKHCICTMWQPPWFISLHLASSFSALALEEPLCEQRSEVGCPSGAVLCSIGLEEEGDGCRPKLSPPPTVSPFRMDQDKVEKRKLSEEVA